MFYMAPLRVVQPIQFPPASGGQISPAEPGLDDPQDRDSVASSLRALRRATVCSAGVCFSPYLYGSRRQARRRQHPAGSVACDCYPADKPPAAGWGKARQAVDGQPVSGALGFG